PSGPVEGEVQGAGGQGHPAEQSIERVLSRDARKIRRSASCQDDGIVRLGPGHPQRFFRAGRCRQALHHLGCLRHLARHVICHADLPPVTNNRRTCSPVGKTRCGELMYSAAAAAPYASASASDRPSAQAAKNPALKVSPAPTVSTTCTGKTGPSTTPLPLTAAAPWDPLLTITCLGPRPRSSQAASSQREHPVIPQASASLGKSQSVAARTCRISARTSS